MSNMSDPAKGHFVQINIRVPKTLHKQIKVHAAEEEQTMQQMILAVLRAYFRGPRGAAPKKSHP